MGVLPGALWRVSIHVVHYNIDACGSDRPSTVARVCGVRVEAAKGEKGPSEGDQ